MERICLIANIANYGVEVALFLLATAAAWRWGGPAARMAALVNLFAWLVTTPANLLPIPETPQAYLVCTLDLITAAAFLCVAATFNSLWIAVAVLAEGVETLDEVETLQGMGCRLFQGFFFSRPLDAAAFVRTVKDPEWLAQLGSPARRQITELTRQVAG